MPFRTVGISAALLGSLTLAAAAATAAKPAERKRPGTHDAALSVVLAEVSARVKARFEVKPGKDRLLLDRKGWEHYKPTDTQVVLGDYDRVLAEWKRMEQEPGYLLEIPDTNWRTAMDRTFPQCATVVLVRAPRPIDSSTVRIDYWVREGGHHPSNDASAILKRRAGKWTVIRRIEPTHWL
jgi:hypothetical protein